MPWRLSLRRRAVRDLDGLPPGDRAAVDAALGRLTAELGSLDIKKLAGRGSVWRLRVGQWRVIFQMHNQLGEIAILRVLHRREAYRD